MRFTRRRALAGAALPFLGVRPAVAQAPRPKRALFLFTPDGMMFDRWNPTGTENDWSLSYTLQPLAPVKSKILVIQGLDIACGKIGPANGHPPGMAGMFSGRVMVKQPNGAIWGGGVTIDQYLGAKIGGATKFRSLVFGVDCNNYYRDCSGYVSYSDVAVPVPSMDGPATAYQRVFAGFTGTPTDAAAAARVRALRKSILDDVVADLAALRQRSGADDRAALDLHLGAIRDIEKQMDALPAASCHTPAAPTAPACCASDTFPARFKVQVDQVVAALACDLTRVALLQIEAAGYTKKFPQLGVPYTHHEVTHGTFPNAQKLEMNSAIERWTTEQFAYMFQKMDSIPDGNGSLLDNTVVLWGNELGNANPHDKGNIPIVMAGGGGHFRMGRYLQYPKGTPHNNLLVSVLNAMGLPDQTFGDAQFCTGPLPRLT
jgi:hypothetical protein